MRFLNPKTDFAFKKIFGSNESKDILISFINAELHFTGKNEIVDLTIIDPYQAPKIKGMKDTYLDVKAQSRDGRGFVIEMQVLNVAGFEKRVLYNAAKAYSIQIASAEEYLDLNPVIAITIADFVMFEDTKEVITTFRLMEKENFFEYKNSDLEMVFIELPKFTKTEAELTNITDKWIYFLRKAGSLEFVPQTLAIEPPIKKAFAIANKANMTREELEDQEHREMFIQDQRGVRIKAMNDGIEKGRDEGRKEGRKEGELIGDIRFVQVEKGITISTKEELEKLTIEQLEGKLRELTVKLII
ncbi:MAG: Rpn family recombination-promoting nuclease/putative transposase [bacterium]